METLRLEKPAPSRRIQWFLILACVLVASLALNAFQCVERSSVARTGDRWRNAMVNGWKNIDRLERENADLQHRLDEMTETAGGHRANGVFHDCTMQALGIYQMEEVKHAYDRYWRSSIMQAKCLAESSWYETHPIGINPAHLSR